ncbi:MAG: (d)CMP kinase [Patescibacteria group bacterium UBA2163]
MPPIKKSIFTFIGDMRQSFLDLTIIIAVVAFFQFLIIREIPESWPSMVIGLIIVGIGLALFLRGLEVGIFPLGEELAHLLSTAKSRAIVIVFGFVVGFATTIAEPALIAIAGKAAAVSGGVLDALTIRLVVALAVGAAIVLGVVRLILNHPIHYYIIGGYVTATVLSFFAPPEIIGIAFDSGGVTTSTVTVPLIAALGIGLARNLKNRDPVIDGFGLIALASVIPMIFVQLYGIAAYQFGFTLPPLGFSADPGVVLTNSSMLASAFAAFSLSDIFAGLMATVGDIIPILLVILFFYYVVLNKTIANIPQRTFGFAMVVIGLYAFVYGLELGLFTIGESLATSLVENGVLWIIYLFAFSIGFATTMAEPALTTIARKAQQVSGGAIKQLVLRVCVAFGAGFGIFLGAYRIVNGDPLIYYLLAGYSLVIVLTIFAPRSITPIAYDSGGVTTSTITVPVVAAIGIGLASSIPGRDPLIDGFGMIALTVLFPIVSVLAYGIFENQAIRRYERKFKEMQGVTVDRILQHLQEEDTDVIQKNKKEIITVTGNPGSGASTIAKTLAERLRYQYFSSGDIFRAVAEKRAVSINTLNKQAQNDTSIDREIDELVQELGIKHTRLVIDSRLAYHWIHRSFKVFLTTDPEVAVKRIRESGECDTTQSLETIKQTMTARHDSKRRRYQDIYGIDIENTAPFDLVIDTTALDAEAVSARIEKAYNTWFCKQK